MCTVSLHQYNECTYLFMNRDERHDRPAELPPQYLDKEESITAPIDPQSKGTWIGMSHQGYAACLLNGYQSSDATRRDIIQSRGNIIERILSSYAPFDAITSFDASAFASFRLLVCNADRHVLYLWDGKTYQRGDVHATYDNAFFITSSSLDEPEVILQRQRIFLKSIPHYEAKPHKIPTLHYSRQPNAEYAPLMFRDYSRTKSITSVVLCHNQKPTMQYHRITYDIAKTGVLT